MEKTPACQGQNKTPSLSAAIRAFNHYMVDTLDQVRPVAGRTVLDLGASPYGFALERALELGVSEYVGVSLDAPEHLPVSNCTGPSGRLLRMDATRLDFPDDRFDLALSMAAFEHFLDGRRVLAEMHRVLKPGGSALVTFDRIWTSARGHHLHHIEPVAELIPPWAYLLLSEGSMRGLLTPRGSGELPMSVDEVLHWIYHSGEINRVDIREFREMFASLSLRPCGWCRLRRKPLEQPVNWQSMLHCTCRTRQKIF
jgi:SAM-dependent methyltransferase